MKRSEINAILIQTKQALSDSKISLPNFAYWNLADWKSCKSDLKTIKKVMQGWDITDYGTENFDEIGSVLFTIRNGLLDEPGVGTPYAEKMLFVKDGQRLPLHYHATKTEDIINRGGGDMFMILYKADKDLAVDTKSDVMIYCDGIPKTVKAGEKFLITRGNSITLTPYTFHTFGAEKGTGDLVAWEVSSVNDDNTDNYWAEDVSRFAGIEEDEEPLHLLCNEYEKFI
ncbi:MAG: D-lyxose/D-mannose family sugar isomerase [Anaerovorax sp.]